MNHKRLLLQLAGLTLVLVLSGACATSQPIPTATPMPTAMPAPPTATPAPPTPPAVPTVAAIASPTEFSSLSPSPRKYMGMAYDAKADRVMLFGGLAGPMFAGYPIPWNGETWAYDVAADKWTQMKPPSGPTARFAAAMAYDAKADRIILFGGAITEQWYLNDTWAYDYNTNTWTQLAQGPPGRSFGGMVYDSASDRIILFGGGCWQCNGSSYNDTWAYDYNTNTWTDMKPSISPPLQNSQVMAYDAKADRVIMWGGDTGWDEDSTVKKDQGVWSYDYNTNTWQEIKPGKGLWPDLRDNAAMAYDAKSDRMIVSGGYYDVGTDETWAYDYNANTWTKLEPNTAGGKLSSSAMVYSTAADRVILFGGLVGGVDSNYTGYAWTFDFSGNPIYTGETWSYDFNTNTWTDVTPHS